ncbi:hypothetical protein pb186bvf_021003 [Paramecium bursaria]
MKFVLILFFVANSQIPDYFHKTDYFDDIDLSGCSKVDNVSTDPYINTYTVNPKSNKKAFILFGEHARELISPETGIKFLQHICKNEIQTDFQLKVILNLNPISRRKVEKGDYCLRLNENGVDLNRNYDAHFLQNQDPQMQTNSGKIPFSEVETRVVKELLDDYQPQVFLSIHSGSLGLYTPYSYDKIQTQNYDELVDILNEVSKDHCPQCDIGPASKNVGYLAYGTSLDYAYDQEHIPYSFIYEIYHHSVHLENEVKLAHVKHAKQEPQRQSFLEINDDMTPQECFERTMTGIQKIGVMQQERHQI